MKNKSEISIKFWLITFAGFFIVEWIRGGISYEFGLLIMILLIISIAYNFDFCKKFL